MPKTKRKSYQQRKKTVQKSVHHFRQIKDCSSSSTGNENQSVVHIDNNDNQRSEVLLIHVEDSNIVQFFPVDFVWAKEIATTLNLSHSTHISTFNSVNYTAAITCGISANPSKVHHIQGDGNCFFRCLSYLITHSEEQHHIVRDLTVRALNRSHLRSNSQTVQQYIDTSKMNCINTWATEVEIMAAASLLQTDICVFALCGVEWKWLRYPASGCLTTEVNPSKRAIYLVNTNSNHYDVVLSVDSTSDFSLTTTLPYAKTTQDLVQEEIQRQCFWQQQKTAQLQSERSKDVTSSACRMRKLRRNNKSYQAKERSQNVDRMKILRSNDIYVQTEKQKNAKRMKETRSNISYIEKENSKNKIQMKTLRANERYAQTEKQQNLKRIKNIRNNEAYKHKEKDQNMKRMKTIRNSETYRHKEQTQNMKRMKTIRDNETYSNKEKQQNLVRMKNMRSNETYINKEKQENMVRMKNIRTNKSYMNKENRQNLTRIKILRAQKEYTQREKQKNIARMKMIRTNESNVEREKQQNVDRMRIMRKNNTFAQKERESNVKRIKNEVTKILCR